MRLLAFVLCSATAAHADTLNIEMVDVSYYFVGSDLLAIDGSIAMTASAYAIGDHPAQRVSRSGFDSTLWTWHVDFRGIEIDGSASCIVEQPPPDMRLSCEP